MQENACRIDDFGPLPVVRPGCAAELGDVVRRAAAEGQALYPVGGGTMLDLGLPPARPGWAVAVGALDRVVDYPARDMTVTVGAGLTLAALRRLLAGEGQRLPVDVPRPERATLGGALAANASGPRRHGFGTLRDYVLGLSTVNDEGHEVKAGGRVVKNVAGYDLPKLHVGALGTLGVLTQVTLKVRPLPETAVLLALGCAAPGLEPLLDAVHRSRTRPACVELLNGSAAGLLSRQAGVRLPEAPWVVVVGFEDSEVVTAWQVRQLLGELAPHAVRGLDARAGAAAAVLWQALADLTAHPAAGLTFKANLLPGALAPLALEATRLAAGASEEFLLHAQAGAGIVRGHLGGALTLARVQAMLEGLGRHAEAARGNVVLPRCPAAWKRLLPVWGRPRGDAWLMRRVKESLDPRGLFNPGRFVDGI